MNPIMTVRKWFAQPYEEKVLDAVTTFMIGGSMLGMISFYVWTAVLLPIGIIAFSMLALIVIADEIFIGRITVQSHRASVNREEPRE